MARRGLSPEEQTLWDAVVRTVRPIKGRRLISAPPVVAPPPAAAKPPKSASAPPPGPKPAPAPIRAPAPVLDSGWEKRIRGGTLVPDMAIDLHGHSLSAAHVRLDRALAQARAQDVRTLLVVTGKPRPRDGGLGGGQRGAIRSEIGHWLHGSAHADAIASVRVAHPRHGGEGALYIILRRKKG